MTVTEKLEHLKDYMATEVEHIAVNAFCQSHFMHFFDSNRTNRLPQRISFNQYLLNLIHERENAELHELKVQVIRRRNSLRTTY